MDIDNWIEAFGDCDPSEKVCIKAPKILRHPEETFEEYSKRFRKFVYDNNVQKDDDLYTIITNKD